MNRYILKMALLAMMIVISGISVIWLPPLDPSNFILAIRSKHQRLEKTASQRIILVGGSNLVFGIDSKKIQDALNRPVVNMGLHAGLGIRYCLNEIKNYIHKGDIIIIIPEYSSMINGSTFLIDLLLFYPQGASYLELPNYLEMLINPQQTMQFRFNGWINSLCYNLEKNKNPIYNVHAFNEYGDVVSHLNATPRPQLSDGVISFDSHRFPYGDESTFISIMNEFNKLASGKGARVLFGFPPVPAEYIKGREYLPSLYKHLKSILPFEFVGDPEKFVFPQSYFFDTVFHLNAKGRTKRTEMLILELKKILPDR